MNRLIFVLLAVLVIAPAAKAQATNRPLIGVYYFSGWWPDSPNKYETAGKDWRPDWPGRKALLGEFVDQVTVDREIDAASQYGVSFFQFLWYRNLAGTVDGKDDHLNDGLRCFLASPNNTKMKFTIEFCNHPKFGITDQAEWEKECHLWAGWMKHPSCLHVGGKAVFKIHGLHFFIKDCGGAKQAADFITTFRRIAREDGAGELLVSAGIGPTEMLDTESAAPFDFFTTYMEVPNPPVRAEPYPYPDLTKPLETALTLGLRSGKMYVPYIPAGWDPRPWHDPRPSFEMPTKEQWTAVLTRTKNALDDNDALGAPLPNGGRQKMLMIYAWNEFGEGGIIAPTQGKQYQMLEGIREVFAK